MADTAYPVQSVLEMRAVMEPAEAVEEYMRPAAGRLTARLAAPKLKVEGVSKAFVTRRGQLNVLQDIEFEVGEGEFVCLIGPSGCGKSTLFNIIAGLEKADRGRVMVAGKPNSGPGPDRVVVFQEGALFPWLTALGNVEFGLEMLGVSRPERREKAMEALRTVQLSRFAEAAVHELSGGMRQRVAIARALAMNPDILLMDEPFAALDAQTRDILNEELQQIWAQTGKTILFVTHNVREAVRLGDRVILLSFRPGRIRNEIPVNHPRPRRADDTRLAEIARAVFRELQADVDRARREELGNA